jgi:hypothetical protein
MDPHSVKAEVTTLKLNPKADGRIAKMSEESKSIVDAVGSRVGTQEVFESGRQGRCKAVIVSKVLAAPSRRKWRVFLSSDPKASKLRLYCVEIKLLRVRAAMCKERVVYMYRQD